MNILGAYWDRFIVGFCKVEFLCYGGEPNWLGWAVLVAFLCLLLYSLLFILEALEQLFGRQK